MDVELKKKIEETLEKIDTNQFSDRVYVGKNITKKDLINLLKEILNAEM